MVREAHGARSEGEATVRSRGRLLPDKAWAVRPSVVEGGLATCAEYGYDRLTERLLEL